MVVVPWIVAGVLVLLLALGVGSRIVLARRLAAHPPIGGFVDAGGAPFHVLDRGDGRAVVLIHGSDGVVLDWTSSGLLDRLAERYRVVAFDRPGHGYSELPRGVHADVETNARLLREGCRALGVERPVLVGHSYGAPIAMRWALDRPEEVAGVVHLAGGAFGRAGPVHPLFRLPAVPILGPLASRTLLVPGFRSMAGTFRLAFFPDPVPPEYLTMMSAFSTRPRQYAAFAEEFRRFGAELEALAPRYVDLRVPLVIVVGERDQEATKEHHGVPLHRAVPGSELVVVPDTGHEIHWKHPELVERAVERAFELAGSDRAGD